MERRSINPWTWQEPLGFVHAHETIGAERTVHCAGQASVDDHGHPVHAGDIVAQTRQALDNLEAVLDAAGMSLADVVRLNYYTTDVDAFMRDAMGCLVRRLTAAGCTPASTLLGVQRLALPELLIEIEATAVA